MKKSGSRESGVFGKAPPLPNQAGYGKQAVELLEKDTKEMEIQLQMLQMRMQQQAEDDANVPKVGGARWKAARPDRGSATRYAKDVQDKHSKSTMRRQEKVKAQVISQTNNAMREVAADMTMGSLTFGSAGEQHQPNMSSQGSSKVGQGSVRAAAANGGGRSNKTPAISFDAAGGGQSRNTSLPAFQMKEIAQWSVSEVVDWLGHVNLSQYNTQFTENEISGPILLEISLEDLDYMGIRALGHRKVLLKGIEDLRKNGRVTIAFAADDSPKKQRNNVPAAHQMVQMNVMESLDEPVIVPTKKYAPRVLDPTTRAQQEAEAIAAQAEAEKKLVHWSAVEPIQQQQEKAGIVGNSNSLHHNNPGDGMIDEEEEKRLFQEAVAEWRGNAGNTAPKVKIIRDGKEVSRVEKPKVEEGMWSNPTGPIMSDYQSDLFDEPASEATDSRGGRNANSFLPPVSSPNKPPVNSSLIYGNTNNNDLKAASMQDLDEAAEQRAFAAAVAEWRGNSGNKSHNQESSSPSNASSSAGVATGASISIAGTSSESSGGQKIAEALAASMEAEQQRIASEMNAKMLAIKARIAEAQKSKVAATQDTFDQEAEVKYRNAALDDSVEEDGEDDYSDYTSRAELAAKARRQQEEEAASNSTYGKTTFVYDSRPMDHSSASTSNIPTLSTTSAGDYGDSPQNSARSAVSYSSPGSVSSSMISPRGGAPPVITGVSTTLGLTDVKAGNEECYVVEEDSDDD
jgi:hypothetical protein